MISRFIRTSGNHLVTELMDLVKNARDDWCKYLDEVTRYDALTVLVDRETEVKEALKSLNCGF